MAENVIKCGFNLFREGRKYTGHHRAYILENAREVCYSPETREGIRMREKLGYFGHGRRQLAGKVRIGEVEKIVTPDGSSLVLENIPSNVTTSFEIDAAGNVSHTQEMLLENAPGKIVAGLNQNRVGGFSWAMGGRDGGKHGATRLSSFEGFDYVIDPGFSENRGYILESAESKDMILESVCSILGVDDAGAEKIVQGWAASSQFYAAELERRLEEAEIFEAAMVEKAGALQIEIGNAKAKLEALEAMIDGRKALVAECAGKMPVVVPADIADALIGMASEEDFFKIKGFFETAGMTDLSRYPLPGQERQSLLVKKVDEQKKIEREYGRAAAAFNSDSFSLWGPLF